MHLNVCVCKWITRLYARLCAKQCTKTARDSTNLLFDNIVQVFPASMQDCITIVEHGSENLRDVRGTEQGQAFWPGQPTFHFDLVIRSDQRPVSVFLQLYYHIQNHGLSSPL